MDISGSSLTPHTHSSMKFLDCDHSLLGGVNIRREFHDLRLHCSEADFWTVGS